MSAPHRHPKERLLERIDQRGPDECWPWLGSVGTWGYGCFWMDGKTINASRAAYILLIGPIADDQVACHSCDNPICCNPKHLWAGSQGDNVRDCNAKGRAKGTFCGLTGAAHPRHVAKLTEEQVSWARRLYADGISQTAIAKQLGVNSGTISRAVRGHTWGHVT